MNKVNRIEWIDELKGFILLLVCLGHIHINFTLIDKGLAISTAFRMTTFFFLSGFLFSTRKYKTVKSYYFNKKRTLLYPYFYLSLIFMLLDPRLWNVDYIYFNNVMYYKLYDILNISYPINNSIEYLYMNLSSIFFIGDSSTITGPLWFVLVLFLTSILFYLIHKICKGNIILVLIYAVICLSLGWTTNSIELPFKLASVFTASFFFSLGYLLKKNIQLLTNYKNVAIIITIIITFPLYMFFINQNGGIGLWNNALGPSIIYFLLSTLTGIYFIINVFIIISRFNNEYIFLIRGILRNIARNALIILSVHSYAINCCKIYLHEYKAEFWYSYLILFIVICSCLIAIPLFRNKLYYLIGKEKISIKESFSIK